MIWIIWNICIHFSFWLFFSLTTKFSTVKEMVARLAELRWIWLCTLWTANQSHLCSGGILNKSKCGIHELGVSEFTLDETRFTFGALQFSTFSSFLHFLLSASRYRFMIHWGLCGRWCNITLCRWAGGVHALEESSQDLISKVFCLFCLLCSNLPNFWHNVAGGHDWCPRRAG